MIDPSKTGRDRSIDATDVDERTIYNFLKGKERKIGSAHSPTLRVVDAYLQASNVIANPSVYGSLFLGTLGAHVAAQYAPQEENRPPPKSWQDEVVGLYSVDARSVYIPGSDRSDRIIIRCGRHRPAHTVHCRVARSSSPDFADIWQQFKGRLAHGRFRGPGDPDDGRAHLPPYCPRDPRSSIC